MNHKSGRLKTNRDAINDKIFREGITSKTNMLLSPILIHYVIKEVCLVFLL